MNLLFADTLDDSAHARALTISDQADNPIMTTVWVLTEVADALASPETRNHFASLLTALRADALCTILPPEQNSFNHGVELYVSRTDKGWSLTDCISFVVMREYGIEEALTGDRHFEQAGFKALLK